MKQAVPETCAKVNHYWKMRTYHHCFVLFVLTSCNNIILYSLCILPSLKSSQLFLYYTFPRRKAYIPESLFHNESTPYANLKII